MANETDTETDTEQAEGGGAKQKLKWIALISLGVVLVATLSVGATWFLLSDGAGSESAQGEMMDMPEITGPASYLAMQPAFIVNYQVGTRTRFLQLELSLVTRDLAAIDVANTHMPVIRNNLLAVLAEQDYERLHSVEGKEALVAELTTAAQAVVESHLGRPGIETVLFRSFVMQ